MKKTTIIKTIGIVTAFSLAVPSASVLADTATSQTDPGFGYFQNADNNSFGMPGFSEGLDGWQGVPGQMNVEMADSASEIVTSDVTCTAASLTADYENASTIVMSDTDNTVSISESGTYIVTGSCSDGSITVKKGVTGVVLILQDLDLTSTSSATVSVNKGAEAQIVIDGTVTLTDAEDPSDETSTDEAVADAFDGAVLKVKDGANVYLTGTGSLTLNADCKNGIKSGDEEGTCLVADGPDITITAA
ncbi:MAG: carbohydrate-binding domain-containing protein, partial [Lachnospiraceae bacterium]|nr:carbohydrate-binding domain-containing protein [Lachnospiraceae bacterium]